MSDTLVRVQNVSKKFCRDLKRSLWYGLKDLGNELLGREHGGNGELRPDEFWALKDVSFELKRGECIGLIGRNGAGKTTLLRVLSGLIKPDTGSLELNGKVGALIALGAGFNPLLTGRENIYISGAIFGLSRSEIDENLSKIISFSELSDFIDAPLQTYSPGMVVRLGFAIAANFRPDILLLDEVLAVGDTAFQSKCLNVLAEFRNRGVGFILVSHNMHQVSRYADKVLLLKNGQVDSRGQADRCIRKYLSDSGRLNSNVEIGFELPERPYGSGRIRFKNAQFRDPDGSVVTQIGVGSAITLELNYEQSLSLGATPVIDVAIVSGEQIVYQATNLDGGVSLRGLPRRGVIKIGFSELPLNASAVYFYVTALDPATKEILDWRRDIKLMINNDRKELGLVLMKPEWEVVCEEADT